MKHREITDTLILLAIGVAAGYLLGISAPDFTSGHGETENCTAAPLSGKLYPVMRVVDGDTLTVWLDDAVETVRLLRIDTPEIGEYGYNSAARALDEMVGRGPVRLEGESPGKLQRDAYGRLLAYVYLGSVCINVEMVRQGWSPYWTAFGPGRLAEEFREAERQARDAATGIWTIAEPQEDTGT